MVVTLDADQLQAFNPQQEGGGVFNAVHQQALVSGADGGGKIMLRIVLVLVFIYFLKPSRKDDSTFLTSGKDTGKHGTNFPQVL